MMVLPRNLNAAIPLLHGQGKFPLEPLTKNSGYVICGEILWDYTKSITKNVIMRNSTKITESSKAANLLQAQLRNLDHEEMWAIFLTRDNGVIVSEMLTKGTLDSTPIDARLILRHALLNNAAGVIIVHNHPSGNLAIFRAFINSLCRDDAQEKRPQGANPVI